MNETSNLAGHFLIAMPTLLDPNFFHGVTLVCEHNAEGAMGVMINRPLNLSLRDILEQMEIPIPSEELAAAQVFLGGPVQPDRGFVIHEPAGEWESSLTVGEDLAVTTSREIVIAISEGKGPVRYLIALGYVGWDAGQLEQELAANSWLSVPLDREILFEAAPELRWKLAAAKLGVDLDSLSHDVGHA